jgi:hypothetical protein
LDEEDQEEGAAARRGPKSSGLDAKAAGFGGEDDDAADAAADEEERKEEEAADADRFNYDALARAYGAKPGYLLSDEGKGGDEEDEDGDEDEDEDEDEGGVQILSFGDELASGSSDDDAAGEASPDPDVEGASSESEDDEPEPDQPMTLTEAVPRGGKNRLVDTTFASFEDYEAMIESDLVENPPARADSVAEDGEAEGEEDDDGEEDDLGAAFALSYEEEGDEAPTKKNATPKRRAVRDSGKNKGPSPPARRVTRAQAAAAARPRSPSGETPAAKKRRR